MHGERKVELKADDHLTVGDSQHVKLGRAWPGPGARSTEGRARMVIEADSELTVKAGGSFIRLDASGIAISGPLARINAGGAPGSGLRGSRSRCRGCRARPTRTAPGAPHEAVATNLPPRQPVCEECLHRRRKRPGARRSAEEPR
ncbi:Rhs element Vgr protein [Pseudomonas aeruginosa]